MPAARLFFSEGGIEEAIEWVKSSKELSVEEKKNFFETLKDIINHIVDTVKEYVTNKNLSNSEKAVANMSLDDIKKLRKQFLSVLDGAIRNLEQGVEVEVETKYSLRKGAEEDVDKVLNNKTYTEDVKLTESSPSIITNQKGVNNYPMLMKASHIRKTYSLKKKQRKRD